MIKLIVSDFDGTLLPYTDTKLSEQVLVRIRLALERGIAFAVSSGRTYRELLTHLSEFSDRIYFISCDGAYYTKNGKPLYEKKIADEDLRFFFDSAQKCTCPFLLHGAERNYSFGSLPADAAHFDAIPITRVTEIPEKIFKITSFCHAVKLPPYSGLRMHWDGGPLAMAQYVNRFANKGAALSDLQMRLIAEKFDTACLGDSENDIPMMRGAALSYCIGDRSSALRSACRFHARTAAEALDAILKS